MRGIKESVGPLGRTHHHEARTVLLHTAIHLRSIVCCCSIDGLALSEQIAADFRRTRARPALT